MSKAISIMILIFFSFINLTFIISTMGFEELCKKFKEESVQGYNRIRYVVLKVKSGVS